MGMQGLIESTVVVEPWGRQEESLDSIIDTKVLPIPSCNCSPPAVWSECYPQIEFVKRLLSKLSNQGVFDRKEIARCVPNTVLHDLPSTSWSLLSQKRLSTPRKRNLQLCSWISERFIGGSHV